MVLVELYLLENLIEKRVEEFVRVLVHDAAEVFVSIAKLVDKGTRGNDALPGGIPGDVHVERAKGEEGRGCRGGWRLGAAEAEGKSGVAFPCSDLRCGRTELAVSKGGFVCCGTVANTSSKRAHLDGIFGVG
jgi:hypothetical protein